jgi:2'-5' RNA ligase
MRDAQGVFDFIRPEPWRPKRPERVFFGLMLPWLGAASIEEVSRDFIDSRDLAGNRIATSRLHISLHHVGDFARIRSPTVYAANVAGASVRMQPFEVTFTRIASFRPAPTKTKWPLVLLAESDALHAFHALLGAAIGQNGFRSVSSFTPHVTLQYATTRIAEQPIEPIRVAFDEFFLIHSERGLTRYNILGRWPLTADRL